MTALSFSTTTLNAMPTEVAQGHIRSALADVNAGELEKAQRRFRWLTLQDFDSPERTARYLHAIALLDRERPVTFSTRASLVPSTNVTRASSEDTFLIFPLDDPENGVSFSVGASARASLSYRDGRSLIGSLDFDKTIASIEELDNTRLGGTLQHEWLSAGQIKQVSLSYAQRSYSDLADRSLSPDYDEWRFHYGASFFHDSGLNYGYTFELNDRNYIERNYMDGVTKAISARFSERLADYGRITVEGTLSNANVENDRYSYVALSLGAKFSRQERNGFSWDLGLGRDWRDYSKNFYSMSEPRSDRTNKISLGVSHRKVTFREAVPKLTCAFSDQNSNVALYTFNSIDCSLALSYSF